MKRKFHLGKIQFGDRINPVNQVDVTLELRKRGGEETFVVDPKTKEKKVVGRTPEYMELSICGNIWNGNHSDIVCGGQCLDTIAQYRGQLKNKEVFDELYDLWKHYHLNGLHAGTPEQEAAIEEWEKAGNKYDYDAVCEMLKARSLYEINYTGMSTGKWYNNEPYNYGHGWLVQILPDDVLQRIECLCA